MWLASGHEMNGSKCAVDGSIQRRDTYLREMPIDLLISVNSCDWPPVNNWQV